MKIVITGSTGFVGKQLIPRLLKVGHEIFEVTIDKNKSVELYKKRTNIFNISENSFLELHEKLIEFQPDLVINLASYLTSKDDKETLKKLLNVNIDFLCNMLDSIRSTGVKYFFYIGTSNEYYLGNEILDPAYLYSATKTAGRILLDYYSKVSNFNYYTIVPFTIYGGKDSQKKVIDIIYDSLNSDISFKLTKGNQILDYIYIEDVIDFFILLIDNIDKVPNKQNFFLGSGQGYNLREITTVLESVTQKKANIEWGGIEHRGRDVMYSVANISSQYNLFEWRPKTTIFEGISKYVSEKSNGK